MKRFVSDATRLAFTRQRMVKGSRGGDPSAQRDEGELLTALARSRAALQAPTTAFVGHAPRPELPPTQAGWGGPPAGGQGSYWQGGPPGGPAPQTDPWGRPVPPPHW
jgi:hypothetical protein